jgi:hypothetical protein
MGWVCDSNCWTAIFTGATAIFTGVALVITWQVYQQSRQDTGRRSPLKIGGERPWVSPIAIPDYGLARESKNWRAFYMYVFNKTSIQQNFRLFDFKILYPFHQIGNLLAPDYEYELASNTGGNLPIIITGINWGPSKTPSGNLPKYLVFLRGCTTGGHKLQFMGYVQLEYVLNLPGRDHFYITPDEKLARSDYWKDNGI